MLALFAPFLLPGLRNSDILNHAGKMTHVQLHLNARVWTDRSNCVHVQKLKSRRLASKDTTLQRVLGV